MDLNMLTNIFNGIMKEIGVYSFYSVKDASNIAFDIMSKKFPEINFNNFTISQAENYFGFELIEKNNEYYETKEESELYIY